MSDRVKTILGIAVSLCIIGFIATRPGGLWHLLGFEEMTTVHSFVIKSPDGLTTSRIVSRMLGDKVHLDIERLNDHHEESFDMSGDEYKKMWDRVNGDIVPGTDHVDYE